MCLYSNGGAYSLIGACVKKCDTAVPLSYLDELFWSGHGRGICYLLGVAIHPWDINIYHPCQISRVQICFEDAMQPELNCNLAGIQMLDICIINGT